MTEEIITLPRSENIILDFFQKIEKQETMNPKTGEKTIQYKKNTDTGGEFVVYNKGHIDEVNKVGTLSYVEGELTITSDDAMNTISFTTETFSGLKKYDIYYIDKKTPDKLQPVSIENENNIKTNKGIVLSFKKKDKKNLNSDLYLYGIYNGEFREETNQKTTQVKKLFTGDVIIFYLDGNVRYMGEMKDGIRCGNGIKYFSNGDRYIGEWKDKKMSGNGIYCYKTGEKYKGKWEDGNMCGYGKFYYHITIQQGQFKNNYLYSGSAYLRDNPKGKSIEEINNEQINPDNKIYTLKRDDKNSNIRILTFYGKVIGIKRDIQIHIDENNIATLQGEPLTEDEINKIKAFFNNISVEQLMSFDLYLATLYYTTIINKEEYRDTNILIPDLCEYNYKEGKEVDQTIAIINQIPQDERKGKYIVPCTWLKKGHQVNLKIDFDNKICEIVNTGDYVDIQVINNLQQTLREQFEGEEWVVYENHIVTQSTGNCVIASNIESVDMEENLNIIRQINILKKDVNSLKKEKKKNKILKQIINNQEKYIKRLQINLGINTEILQKQYPLQKFTSMDSRLLILQLKYDKLFEILEQSNKLDSFLQLNSIITIEQEKELNKIKKEKDKIKKQREILKENYCLMEFNRINKLEQEFNNNFEKDSIDYRSSCFRWGVV